MKTSAAYYGLFLLVVISFLISTRAFVPQTHLTKNAFVNPSRSDLRRSMGLMSGDDKPQGITRDSEPDQFFST
jgi:hypothetical protein